MTYLEYFARPVAISFEQATQDPDTWLDAYLDQYKVGFDHIRFWLYKEWAYHQMVVLGNVHVSYPTYVLATWAEYELQEECGVILQTKNIKS